MNHVAQPDAAPGADEEPGSLAEKAYRLIEDMIVRLELPPGARLTEHELSSRIGLGRTPVREALQRLHADGLVLVFPRKGIAVSDVNPLEVLVALETRGALERLVAVSAARRIDEGARETVAQLGKAMVAAAQAQDVARYIQADKEADRFLVRVSGNACAGRALAPLQAMTRRAWFFFRRDGDLIAAAERHERVLDAVAAGDAAAADTAASVLVGFVRDRIKDAVNVL